MTRYKNISANPVAKTLLRLFNLPALCCLHFAKKNYSVFPEPDVEQEVGWLGLAQALGPLWLSLAQARPNN